MADRLPDELRRAVRNAYGAIAGGGKEGCGCGAECCGESGAAGVRSMDLGYSDTDMGAAPRGADLRLGCGDPCAIASLGEGETVVDLGSGAGLDCFLAARGVGEGGRVIGVDMTPEMVARAREDARISARDYVVRAYAEARKPTRGS